MKLEPKHVTPYFSYYLKVIIDEHETHLLAIKDEMLKVGLHRFPYSQDVMYCDVKPILRPLSDLDKEIEHKRETFVPIDIIGSMRKTGYTWNCVENNGDVILGSWDEDKREMIGAKMSQYQKLFEWHFDVFGLIEQGLAIKKS